MVVFGVELQDRVRNEKLRCVNESYEFRTTWTRSDGCNAPYGIEERHRALVSGPVSTIDGEKGAKKAEMDGTEECRVGCSR